MSSIKPHTVLEQHGGNLSWIEQRYPDAPKPFIDLSTGINPYGYPVRMNPQWQHTLAEEAAMEEAYKAAAHYYGAKHCALAPGMQPLMMAMAALRLKEYGVSSIGIVSPTYVEHERVWQQMGHECHPVANPPKAQHDVIIICNPNNPDGRHMAPEQLLTLAERLAWNDGWLVVDESFADVLPAQSVAPAAHKYPNMVVMRSCGKFFGVAGMRVSTAIAAEPCIEWLRTLLGPWPISTAACHLLPEMMRDMAWINTTLSQLEEEALAWRELLEGYFTIVGGTDLFTLVETDQAGEWYDYLASQGILARQFDYNLRWLRFGLPDMQHMERLKAVLAGFS